MISPCILVCSLDPASGLCMGCGRSLDEIASWSSLGDHERLALMESLPERLQALNASAESSSSTVGGDAA
ncbi:DUF1289 domain-containing protein [Rhizobium oryzicola]|uniref:DUF1289 domain-containing protein n=1 Tax=Rhizobium oryzicola TaxID=1232668 RepID=A0ABT8T1N1_9HYPH|nr:DUF1289 domain-containing protein [Rhizobium oryzicola]MDO1584655.1 DUF1289 domain-containing protein [Rhizobium oryzicola]